MTLDNVSGYFNTYNAGEAWSTNPGNMTNGTFDSYADTTTNADIQELTGNSCVTDDVGNISTVSIRLYGYGDGDDQITFRPVFSAGEGTNNLHVVAAPAWSSWIDITTDTNAPVLKQVTDDGGTSIYTDRWSAQAFEWDKNITVSFVKLKLQKTGSPSGNFVMGIRSSLTGSDLANDTMVADTISTSATWYQFDFTNLDLTSSTSYYIVCRCPDGDINNRISWRQATSDVYADGEAYSSTDGGSNWSAPIYTIDFCFDFDYQTWTWTDVYNLDADVEHTDISKGNTSHCGQVEVIVTYEVAGVQAYEKSFSDTLDMNDTLSRHCDYSRSLSDTLDTTDTLNRQCVYSRSLSDTLDISDSFTAAKIFLRAFSDTLDISDSLSRKCDYFRSLSDTLDLTDVYSRKATYLRAFNDILVTADTFSRHCDYLRTFSDTLDINDSATLVKIIFKTFSDTLDLSDTFSRKASYLRTFSDTLNIIDSFAKGRAFLKTFSDTLDLSDSLSRQCDYIRSFSDILSIDDTFNRKANFLRTLSDTLGITDSFSRQCDYLRSLSDTLDINDTFSRKASYLRILSDTLDITDNLSRLMGYQRTFSDTLDLTDLLSYITIIAAAFDLPFKFDTKNEEFYKLTEIINSYYQMKKETDSHFDMVGTNENIYKTKHKKNNYYKMTED